MASVAVAGENGRTISAVISSPLKKKEISPWTINFDDVIGRTNFFFLFFRLDWQKIQLGQSPSEKKKHRGISRFFFFLVGLNFLLLSSHVFFLFESRDFSLYNERCTSSSSLSLRVCWTINQQRERIPPGALYANESWVGIVRAHAPPASSQPLRAVIFFFLPGENVGQSVQFVALLLSSSFSVSLSLSFSPGVRPGFFFFLSFLFYYYLVAKSFALRFSFDFSFFFDAQLTIYLYMV